MNRQLTPDPRPRTPVVGIVLGSDSDRAVMEDAAKTLAEFDVPHELTVASAHRSPDLLDRYARTAEERGVRVLIAAAGGAAHLAGSLAARTVLPVIGVPLEATGLGGLDALLSTAQMPPGVPVATVSIGSWGARNAALLAVQILSTNDATLRERFREFKIKMASKFESVYQRVDRCR
jgi:phosphoribosylaminoimidazole carboxylase PurE protein